jgi:hypothetical protein
MRGGNRGALGCCSPETSAMLSAPRAPPEWQASLRERERQFAVFTLPSNDKRPNSRDVRESFWLAPPIRSRLLLSLTLRCARTRVSGFCHVISRGITLA